MRPAAVHAHAKAAHEACTRARGAAWKVRNVIKAADPDAWAELCRAIADATHEAGQAMDMTAEPVRVDFDVDDEEIREAIRESTWMQQ